MLSSVPIMRNEANFSIADFGLGTDLWQGGESCKTNPISPVGWGPGERNAQNEPNFPGGAGWPPSPPKPIVRNEAKLGLAGVSGGPRVGEAYCAKRSQFAGRSACQTKPIVQSEANFSGQPWPRRTKCAKRTQFPPSRAPGNTRLCKTKPISRPWRERTGVGRGKAPVAAEVDCAKRTQFPPGEIPHHSTIPLFQYSDPMPIVQNEANLRSSGRTDGPDTHRRMPVTPAVGIAEKPDAAWGRLC